ncbi:MAG: hypothetical protein QOD84_2757 [Acidobacteriaceae bacterium]|jgi:hypothetical protein
MRAAIEGGRGYSRQKELPVLSHSRVRKTPWRGYTAAAECLPGTFWENLYQSELIIVREGWRYNEQKGTEPLW